MEHDESQGPRLEIQTSQYHRLLQTCLGQQKRKYPQIELNAQAGPICTGVHRSTNDWLVHDNLSGSGPYRRYAQVHRLILYI